MITVIIVIHLMVVLLMVVLVLLQRSEGGALGIGGGGGGLTSRGTGNVLTRTTSILVAVFFTTSLGMSILTRQIESSTGVLDAATNAESESPTDTDDAETESPTNVLRALREQSGLEDPEVPDTQ